MRLSQVNGLTRVASAPGFNIISRTAERPKRHLADMATIRVSAVRGAYPGSSRIMPITFEAAASAINHLAERD